MTITFPLNDINGFPIEEGSRVFGYAKEFHERSRDESGPIPIVELDTSRPKPMKDVPLFVGIVKWDQEQLALLVFIEKILVEWECDIATVRMGGDNYHFELAP